MTLLWCPWEARSYRCQLVVNCEGCAQMYKISRQGMCCLKFLVSSVRSSLRHALNCHNMQLRVTHATSHCNYLLERTQSHVFHQTFPGGSSLGENGTLLRRHLHNSWTGNLTWPLLNYIAHHCENMNMNTPQHYVTVGGTRQYNDWMVRIQRFLWYCLFKSKDHLFAIGWDFICTHPEI